jgi:hypothetical protein
MSHYLRPCLTPLPAACTAATSIPFFLAFATKSLAWCWALQLVTLALAAYTMALLPAICSNLYPAGVRISGFNFAYNVGMMVFGGLVSGGPCVAGGDWMDWGGHGRALSVMHWVWGMAPFAQCA